MSDLARELRQRHGLDAAPADDPLRVAVEEIERLDAVVKAAGRALRDAQRQIATLIDEREANGADARRYRWLRDPTHAEVLKSLDPETGGETLDDEIDEAIARTGPAAH